MSLETVEFTELIREAFARAAANDQPLPQPSVQRWLRCPVCRQHTLHESLIGDECIFYRCYECNDKRALEYIR